MNRESINQARGTQARGTPGDQALGSWINNVLQNIKRSRWSVWCNHSRCFLCHKGKCKLGPGKPLIQKSVCPKWVPPFVPPSKTLLTICINKIIAACQKAQFPPSPFPPLKTTSTWKDAISTFHNRFAVLRYVYSSSQQNFWAVVNWFFLVTVDVSASPVLSVNQVRENVVSGIWSTLYIY